MSKVCNTCGGVLGVDCWSPYDCYQISRYQDQELQYLQQESKDIPVIIDMLEQAILTLVEVNLRLQYNV